ncbi:hypothetical protein L6R52_36645 [Myxococcota bacterium]|nr:hypothetical protein [Myxococcota bacterium]
MKRIASASTLFALLLGCGASQLAHRDAGPEPAQDAAPADGGARPDAPSSLDAALDAGVALDASTTVDAAAGVIDTGRVYLDACAALPAPCTGSTDPTCGSCEYRLLVDARRCTPETPCDELVVHFAAMGCDRGPMEQTVARHPEILAACVQPLSPGELLPSSIGAPEREEVVLPAVLALARRSGWSGRELLFSGCSAGASRYPVVAARHANDAAWTGSAKTAVCMSDGVVSVVEQEDFVGAQASTSPSCRARHARIARAYTTASPTAGHACSGSPNAQCACDPGHVARTWAGSCAATGGDCVRFDTIVARAAGGFDFVPGVTAESFAVRHWKLVSEGSASANTSARCEDDVVGEDPFRGLCELLDADAEHTCTFATFPDDAHCARYAQSFDDVCITWFRAL